MKELLEKIAKYFVWVMQAIIYLSILLALLIYAVEYLEQLCESPNRFCSVAEWFSPELVGIWLVVWVLLLAVSFAWLWGGILLIHRMVSKGRRWVARCISLLLLFPVSVLLLGLPAFSWGMFPKDGNYWALGAAGVAFALWLWLLGAVGLRYRESLADNVRQELARRGVFSRLSFEVQRVACGMVDGLRAPFLGILVLLHAILAYGLPLFWLLLLLVFYIVSLCALGGILPQLLQEPDALGNANSWQLLGLASLWPVVGYATADWLARSAGKPLRVLDIFLLVLSLLLACAAPCCLGVMVLAWLSDAEWPTILFLSAVSLHFLLPLVLCYVEKKRRTTQSNGKRTETQS